MFMKMHYRSITANEEYKKSSDMEDKIFDIVTDLIRDDISKNEAIDKLLILYSFVYVVTERDNHGEQLFKGVFSTRQKALQYLAEDGLKESNIDEINEIELD